MNKEDILRKSREENQNGDEREEKIKLKSYAISAAIGALLCMILVIVEGVLFDRSTTLIWLIYSGMMFSQRLLDAIKLKKRFDVISSVIWGIICTIYIIIYILDNVG